MAQATDFTLSNQAFGTFRTELNSILSAVNSCQSGTTTPPSATVGTIWLDTTNANPTLKYYDGADNISLATIDHTANTVNWLDSTVSVTGLTTTATGTVLTLSDTNLNSTVSIRIPTSKGIDDDSGNEFLKFTKTASAVNEFTIINSATGDAPEIQATGGDTNIDLKITPKGSGKINLDGIKFPNADGSANQALVTDGSGSLSFATIATFNTPLEVVGNATAGSEIRLPEDTDNGSNYVALKAPNTIASNLTLTLPSADGTANQLLKTDGSGNLSFTTPSAGFSGANENAIGSSSITLTSASTQYQKVQINTLANSFVTLPDATTLTTEGTPVFAIENSSPIGVSLDIKNNSGNIIGTVADNFVGFCSLLDNSTSAGTWNISNTSNQAVLTIDSTVNSNTPTAKAWTRLIHLTSTKLLLVSFTVTSDTVLTAYTKIGDIAGSTITFGSEQSTTLTNASGLLLSGEGARTDVVRLSDSSFILLWGIFATDGSIIRRVSANTVSGTTITFGSQNSLSFPTGATDTMQRGASAFNGICCRMADDKFAVVYNTTTVSGASIWLKAYSGSLGCNIITVSGTTLTVGTKVDLGSSTYTQPITLVCHDTDRLCVMYFQHTSGSGNGRNKVNIISVSGTTPTWGTSVNVEASDVTDVWEVAGADNVAFGYITTFQYNIPSSINSCWGVALSSTLVLGLGGGLTGYVLVSISGTTPTIVTNLYVHANSLRIPPIAINSTTVYVSSPTLISTLGRYLKLSSSGMKFSPQAILTAQSVNLTNFPMYVFTTRGTSASTLFTAFSFNSVGIPVYVSIGTFSA